MTTQARTSPDSGRSELDEPVPRDRLDPPAQQRDTGPVALAEHDHLGLRPGTVPAVTTNGATVATAEAFDAHVRSSRLESLWFRLSDPDYITTAIVPVPGVTAEEAQSAAAELAKVGSSITGGPVHVVTAVSLHPAQALETSRGVAAHNGDPLIVVVESPTIDPGSIPIVRNCERSLLLVGLRVSRNDELDEITELIGSDRVMGAVCLEPDSKRRWWNRRR